MAQTAEARDESIQRVLAFVQEFHQAHGRQPTQREIGEHLDMSRHYVERSINWLIGRGTLPLDQAS